MRICKKNSKKGTFFLLGGIPWMVLIVFIGVLVVAILAWLKTASVAYTDQNRMTVTALYSMLNSNDCTPKTKLLFKDVIGVGLSQGTPMTDIIYGGNEDGRDPILGVSLFSVKSCVSRMAGNLKLKEPWLFYVEYPGCSKSEYPNGVPKCFRTYGGPPTGNTNSLSIEAVSYVAIPNGTIAKVVLKTSG